MQSLLRIFFALGMATVFGVLLLFGVVVTLMLIGSQANGAEEAAGLLRCVSASAPLVGAGAAAGACG
ncbi:MAG: hypothetical protein HY521_12120 [Proteobacteria bacterium]|nr:hypothetical protein [Pseudomonadota bacterium]